LLQCEGAGFVKAFGGDFGDVLDAFGVAEADVAEFGLGHRSAKRSLHLRRIFANNKGVPIETKSRSLSRRGDFGMTA
jgi:hypothetical protein